MRLAIFYLAAITAAEIVTNIPELEAAITGTWPELDPNLLYLKIVGIICYVIILIALIIQSSLASESPQRKLLLALCLVPLTRILSLSMPLTPFDLVYWWLIIYPALFLAAWVTMRHLNFNLLLFSKRKQ